MLARGFLRGVRGIASGSTYKVPESARLSFREKGYAVLPNFLTELELRPIEAVYDKFMRGEVPIPGKDFCDMSQTFDAIKGKHPNDWQIVNAMLPRKYWPALQNNIYEQRAADAAGQLFPGTRMALDYDQLLNKRPGKAGAVFAWHQDMAVSPPSSPLAWGCALQYLCPPTERYPPTHAPTYPRNTHAHRTCLCATVLARA
jgi:phytanoyl-CoA hydroxylase